MNAVKLLSIQYTQALQTAQTEMKAIWFRKSHSYCDSNKDKMSKTPKSSPAQDLKITVSLEESLLDAPPEAHNAKINNVYVFQSSRHF